MKIVIEFTKATRFEFIRLTGRIRALCHKQKKAAPRVSVEHAGPGRKIGYIEY